MTVSTDIVEHSYYPGAAMAPEAIPFQYLDAGDLAVERIDGVTGVRTALIRDLAYQISGDGPSRTGRITALLPFDIADLLRIERQTDPVQMARIVPHLPLPAAALERQLDRQTMLAQEALGAVDRLGARAMRLPIGETAPVLPGPLTRRDTVLGFGALGALTLRTMSALAAAIAPFLPAALKGDPGGAGYFSGSFANIAAQRIPIGTDTLLLTDATVVERSAEVDAGYVVANPATAIRDLNGAGFRKVFAKGGPYHLRRDFGCSGVIDEDQTPYVEAMMAWLRDKDDRVHVIGDGEGSVITCTNPYAWNGLREAWMQGRGTAIMNPRGGPGANADYTSNYIAIALGNNPWSPNGWRRLTYGDGQGPLANDFGLAIHQVAKGATQITRKSGALFRGRGWCELFSNSRINFDGVPPCPINFEYINIDRVSGDGQTAFLSSPTQNAYEEFAPVNPYAAAGSGSYGPAMCVQFERPDGQFRATRWSDRQLWEDWRFMKNPAFTGTQSYANALAYLGSGEFIGRRLVFENFCGIGSSRDFLLEDCNCIELEIDKDVERGVIRRGTYGNIVGGTGAKRIDIEDVVRTGYLTVGPIETLRISGGVHSGGDSTLPSAALLNTYGWVTRNLIIDGAARFVPPDPADRFAYGGNITMGVQVVDANTLRIGRAAWDNPNVLTFALGAQPGVMLYSVEGSPVFELTRLPHCDHPSVPAATAETGDVFLTGVMHNKGVVTGNTLLMPRFPSVTVDPSVTVEGPNAPSVQTFFGLSNDGFNTYIGDHRVPRVNQSRALLDNRMRDGAPAADVYLKVGSPVIAQAIMVNVERVGSGGLLYLRTQRYNGATEDIVTIDLTRAGIRRLMPDGALANGGGADAAASFPTQPFLVVNADDTSALLATPAVWSAVVTFDRI